MKTLYEPSPCFDEGYLSVSDTHSLYYAQYGAPDGVPVIFLHGGPGGGCAPIMSQYFDPEHYRVILLDQRGAAQSKPLGNMDDNTSAHLVADIEQLRKHLNIEKWHVFGGSWGSTLSLLYAIAHPTKVISMVLRGVFLGTHAETEWIFSEHGAASIYPEEFERFINFIPEQERGDIIEAYHQRIFGADHDVMMQACHEWCRWENALVRIFPAAYDMSDDLALSMGRAECQYFLNNFFIEDNYILDNSAHITGIPCTIVQGRFDSICPPSAAYALHKALPQSTLNIVQLGSHASMEASLVNGLVSAMDTHKQY